MTNTSKTIVFFGTDDFSALTLRRLITDGYSIAAVVTKPDSQKGRGRSLQKPVTKEIAEEHGIPVWQPEKVSDIAKNLAALGEKPVGVLVSYGKIIPQAIIDMLSPGIINVHPSLLPTYRGPSPVETAIRNGDQETGVTIMQLSAAMDAGPIYKQVRVQLDGSETGPSLREDLGTIGAQEISTLLPVIASGTLQPVPQNDEQATYCRLFTKEDAALDLTRLSAAQADQHIRAHLGFPKSKLSLRDIPVVITRAHTSDTATTALDLPCTDGRFLCIDELIGPSGKKMPSQAFLNGYLQ